MKLQLSSSLLLSALILFGCTDDESFDMVQVREIRATLNGFKSEEEAVTRTTHTISEVSGFQTLWAKGDVLGIFPIGGDQVTFPISDGVGTTTAKFDGGSWALRGTYKYAAYYPFNPECYMIGQTAIPVSFAGQTQNGNNSMSHLADVDFMAAAGTQPSANGSVNLQFNHVGCFLRMQFTMPEAADFTEVTVSVEGGSFAVKGDVDLSASTPSLHPTTKLNKLMLSLKNVHTTAANQTITLYMMVAPDDMMGKTLTFAVKDSKGKVYAKTAAGKRMMANYAYNYSFAFTSSDILGIDGTTGGGGWATSPDPNGHEYVDLGLPSGTLWATCNVGANSPEECGDFFAWGERKPKGDIYRWTTYKHRKTVALDSWGRTESAVIAKYCTGTYPGEVDNKTVLDHQDDAAAINWGGDWRMPTAEEFQELIDECLWSHVPGGYQVTSRTNGRYIILKKEGVKHIGLHHDTYWIYWTSSLSDSRNNEALALYGAYGIQNAQRSHGRQVRAVLPSSIPSGASHEYVDLGLKDEYGNTLFWATCNVGAVNPEDAGLYFAWGESTGYSSSQRHNFDDLNYALYQSDMYGVYRGYTEYCTHSSYGLYDGRTSLSSQDDAAHVNWGGNWRMPTKTELDALCTQCTWKWTSLNGVSGFRIIGHNGNSIFLPAVGHRWTDELWSVVSYGYYWSSSLNTEYNGSAYILHFGSGRQYMDYTSRYYGLPIRPVCVLP